jgi:hypothetical protein
LGAAHLPDEWLFTKGAVRSQAGTHRLIADGTILRTAGEPFPICPLTVSQYQSLLVCSGRLLRAKVVSMFKQSLPAKIVAHQPWTLFSPHGKRHTRMHTTLTPRTNFSMIAIMLVAAAAVPYFFPRPFLWAEFALGAAIGIVAGICQLRALRDTAAMLLAADGALAVRRALKTSRSGRAYLAVFWIGNIAIVALALYLFGSDMVAGCIAGYVMMALVRDVITLPGTFSLARMEKQSLRRRIATDELGPVRPSRSKHLHPKPDQPPAANQNPKCRQNAHRIIGERFEHP